MSKKVKDSAPAKEAQLKDLATRLHALAEAMEIVGKEMSALDTNVDLDSFKSNLDNAVNVMMSNTYKKDLCSFAVEISAKLRSTPAGQRPHFDSKVGFFLWVMKNLEEAENKMPLLDKTDTCPDRFRNKIEEHHTDSKYKYVQEF